jgi:two-component system NtrC family sensor kinase
MRQGEILGYVAAVRDITERRRADDALRHVRDNLERRVQERTAELMQANEILRQEIAVRRHAEEQLHQQREALYHREKLAAMGSLLASVAHELNNPLSVVMMQADLLREDIREGLLAEQAKIIAQSAERCVRIVRNFLTLARPHPPERQPVALNTVVREAVELLAYGLRVDNIEVTLDLASKLPAVGGDAHQLHQVVANLITNAHQALREVPSPRRLTLTTHDDPTHHRVVLVVADTGPGIPLQLQERIFEPFFTTKPPGIGTGLGLPLCRGIIEGHGGTIQVQSQPGQGTMFQIALPSEVFPATAATPPSLEALPVRQQTPTILVVDDEPGIATGLAYLLRRSGYTVDIAANGRLALGQLQERDYDLILCDLRMPELDGPGFYRRLGESYPHLLQRVIFLTGDTLSPEAQEFLDKLEVSRLNKPFRAAEVRRVVEQVLHTL